MFELFIKGIIIGLSISVPLGPIGMLCVQRTFKRGRLAGLATGLGATTSDLLYAVLTMFFLNFILGFVEQYQLTIQIVGSIIIGIFGVYIFRSKPVHISKFHGIKIKKKTIALDFISSLSLTLSNPLIIFVLIALFAKLDFISLQDSITKQSFGLFFILLGAFLWWFTLTFIIGFFHRKMKYNFLMIINRTMGVIIIIIGIIGVVKTIIEL